MALRDTARDVARLIPSVRALHDHALTLARERDQSVEQTRGLAVERDALRAALESAEAECVGLRRAVDEVAVERAVTADRLRDAELGRDAAHTRLDALENSSRILARALQGEAELTAIIATLETEREARSRWVDYLQSEIDNRDVEMRTDRETIAARDEQIASLTEAGARLPERPTEPTPARGVELESAALEDMKLKLFKATGDARRAAVMNDALLTELRAAETRLRTLGGPKD